jgi:hypothetical protein
MKSIGRAHRTETGDRHIDIASDRIRVQTDRRSTLNDPFSNLLVDASHGDG